MSRDKVLVENYYKFTIVSSISFLYTVSKSYYPHAFVSVFVPRFPRFFCFIYVDLSTKNVHDSSMILTPTFEKSNDTIVNFHEFSNNALFFDICVNFWAFLGGGDGQISGDGWG